MRFANPWWFLILLPVAVLGWIYWKRSKKPDGIKFSDLNIMEKIQPRSLIGPDEILAIITLLGIILCVCAMARPQAGLTTEQISGQGVDIILCLDTSGSMRSVDFRPQNRLGAAKEVAKKFIETRLRDRIGLVVFGGAAMTICPITIDKGALQELLSLTSIDMTQVDGTAVGMAIATAADRMRTSQAKSKVIILLTDGRNNTGAVDPITAAKAAGALGIKIYAIGAGSPEGGIMPVQDPMYGTRYVRIPENDLDEDTLRSVAAASNGVYFRAKDSRGLEEIFKKISDLEKSDYKITEFTHYRDLYPNWLGAGIILLFISFILSETFFRRIP
jgi:Ca-activated chloride channel family protein